MSKLSITLKSPARAGVVAFGLPLFPHVREGKILRVREAREQFFPQVLGQQESRGFVKEHGLQPKPLGGGGKTRHLGRVKGRSLLVVVARGKQRVDEFRFGLAGKKVLAGERLSDAFLDLADGQWFAGVADVVDDTAENVEQEGVFVIEQGSHNFSAPP